MEGIIIGAIEIGVIFLFGSVGEIITEKSGHLNLGIPGIMCMGMAGGCFAIIEYMQCLADYSTASYAVLLLVGVLGACIFAGFGGVIYSFLTVNLRVNQNVVGLALTIFGSGISQFMMNTIFKALPNGKSFLASASVKFHESLPFAGDLGWFGRIFLSHGLLVYLAIAIAIIAAMILRKSRAGLHLRSIGESPATADAAGINVNLYKHVAILIGSAIAGLGGFFCVIYYKSGTFDNTSTIQALGWIAIALVIFTLWRPDLSILGSFVFGALYILGYKDIGLSSPSQVELIKLLPYIITIIVLIITSIIGKKETQPPASLGLNYFREER